MRNYNYGLTKYSDLTCVVETGQEFTAILAPLVFLKINIKVTKEMRLLFAKILKRLRPVIKKHIQVVRKFIFNINIDDTHFRGF